MYIDVLKVELNKPMIFFKYYVKIHMNPFGIYEGNLWQEKYVYIQSIFDFYVIVASYCTLYLIIFFK